MLNLFPRRISAQNSDPRVRAAVRAAAAVACETLEPRKLLAAVAGEEPVYNISGTRPDTKVDHRPYPTAELQAVVPGAKFAATTRQSQNTSPQQITAAAEDTGTPTISALSNTPQTFSGALNGKIIYTSGGHGWQWNSGLGRYATDRPDYNEIIEDFGNQEQMTYYADYVLRAGGTVVPMRPVGRQTNEVVLDNDSAGVTFTGSWTNSGSTRFYDEDYGATADAVPYRFADTTTGAETAVATYTPNIPQAGLYPVYTWVLRGTDRTNQLYRINHTGGTTEIRVNHSMVGSGWVYLGTYHFNAGSSSTLGAVQISNNGPADDVVIADTIRFGNGINDDTAILGAPTPSNYPREDENSYHWLYRAAGQGIAASSIIGSGNVSAPSLMAEYMNADTNPFGTSVYIGFHSNGTTGDPNTATARGAVGLIDSDQFTPHQHDLALYTGRQINQDMQALNGTFEHNWSNRTTHTFASGFGEIDNGAGAEMDATIIEVGFHDNTQDSQLMRDPKVRDQLGRSTYEATLEYFDNWGGLTAPASQPRAPGAVRAIAEADGDIVVSWSAPVGGPAATGYKLYYSRDGYGFSNPVTLAGAGATSHTFSAADLDDDAYYFRVAATNAGGESPGSVVVGARKDQDGGTNRILIVNGFDRYHRSQNHRYPYAHTGDGRVDRTWARYSNSFDYVVQAGEAIEAYIAPGSSFFGFDSAQNENVINNQVNLNNYDAVIWLSGEESTADETFNATEQTRVASFLGAGGHLFVSGAEIGWDLEAQGGGAAFYNNTLKTDYIADDANAYTASGVAGSIFAGVSIAFDNGTPFNNGADQFYDTETPDRIAPGAGATLAMNYAGGLGAAIQYLDPGTGSRIVSFGFPFETITTLANRTTVMDRVLDFFALEGSSVAGKLYADHNDNGTQDAGEPGLSGVVVTIDSNNNGSLGAGDAAATTDGAGDYTIQNVPAGTFLLGAAALVGYTHLDTNPQNVVVAAGATVTGQNFRLFPNTFTGTAGNDHYYLRLNAAGTRLEIHNAAAPLVTPTYSVNAGVIASLIFNAAGGDDSLTADYTNGNLTTGNSFFNGGADATAAGDLLRIIGTGGADEFDVSATVVVTKRAGDVTPHTMDPNGVELIRVEGGDGDDVLDYAGSIPRLEDVVFAAGAGDNTLNVNSGTFDLPTDAAAESSNLTVNVNGSGASVTFGATQHLAALNLAPGTSAFLAAGGDKYLFTRGLDVDGAVLQMNDNDLIVDYADGGPSPEFPLRDLVKATAEGGTNGIAFSAGDGDVILAIAEGTESGFTNFNGEELDETAVIGKYTYYGDANLDGMVTSDDYVSVDVGIGVGNSWVEGDFDLNGEVTSDDYVSIDVNLGKGVGAPLLIDEGDASLEELLA